MLYKVKRYSVEDLLIFIGNYNLNMFNEGSPIKEIKFIKKYGGSKVLSTYICAWDLKDIAYYAVKYSNDYKNSKIKLDDFYEIFNEYKRDEDNKTKNFIKEPSLLYLLYGMSQQQFWYQHRYESRIEFNRNIELIKYISQKIENSIDVNSIMHEVLGMTIDEYLYLCIMIFSVGLEKIDITYLVTNKNSIDFLDISHEKLKRFIELYTITYEEVRSAPLEQNVFLTKPIVKSDKGKYIIHNQFLLLKILSDGLYWVIRNYYCAKKSLRFTNEFGLYFEAYVEDLFKTYLLESQYSKPKEIRNKKIADWIIEVENYVIIIEQKSAIASLKLKQQYPNIDDLEKYLKNYSEAFNQLNSTETTLNNIDGRIVIKLVLHYDSLYAKEIIKQHITKSRVDTKELDKNIFFIGISELEILISLANENTELFLKVIDEKLKREKENSKYGRDFSTIFNLYDIRENFYINEHKDYFKYMIESV